MLNVELLTFEGLLGLMELGSFSRETDRRRLPPVSEVTMDLGLVIVVGVGIRLKRREYYKLIWRT